jgi:hypothetical protein
MVMKNTMTTGVQDSGLSGDSRAAVAWIRGNEKKCKQEPLSSSE